jgi:hypothetical protein
LLGLSTEAHGRHRLDPTSHFYSQVRYLA